MKPLAERRNSARLNAELSCDLERWWSLFPGQR
jgi:hypothetical protein